MYPSATELSFDSNMMWLTLVDGRRLGVPLAYFPRLLAATPHTRQSDRSLILTAVSSISAGYPVLLAYCSEPQARRARLEQLAEEQARYGSFNVTFDQDDIVLAYARSGDQPDWLRGLDPWSFYDEDEILKRQVRWREEDEQKAARATNSAASLSSPPTWTGPIETFVRATPKLGRNDPCHCGSGKKYKKCCMAADTLTAMHE